MMPEPASDLVHALRDERIVGPRFRDPTRFDLKLKNVRCSENQRVEPGAIKAACLTSEITKPLFGQTAAIPFTNREHTQRLLDFDKAPTPATISHLSEIRRFAPRHSADDFKECEEHALVGPIFRRRSENVKAAPATLDRFLERNTDVEFSPESA